MEAITRFEDLKCWQAARVLTKMVYDISKQGLLAKDFDLRSQIRRASVSSMSNIAEGFGRFSNREFIRFLEISQGSAQEIRSISYVVEDQGYLDIKKIENLRAEAEKAKSLTLGLIRYLKRT
jgi:four helix bundle protein